jgi:hypothetical protein
MAGLHRPLPGFKPLHLHCHLVIVLIFKHAALLCG